MKLRLKITLIFLLCSMGMRAQQYQLFTASSDNTVKMKWLSKSMPANGSYDVFRKDGGSWQKINDNPIVPSPVIKESELNSAKNPFPKDSSYAFYIKYRNAKEASANKQAYVDYTLALAAIYNNEVARHMGIYYEDNKSEKGKRYQYKLVESASQKELAVAAEITAGEIPAAPSDFKAKQEKQNVVFDWKVNEEFIGYNIYRNGTKVNSEPILPNLEGKTYLATFRDDNLKPGNYKYVIKSITYVGTESKPSNEITIDVRDMTPPTGIKNFNAERKDNEILLQWTASADKDVKGYNVFKSDDKGKTFRKINVQLLDSKTTQFSEKGDADNFGAFQYYIETQDEAGNSMVSIKSSVFIPDHKAPEMPKGFTSKTESGKISLSWNANTEKDLAGYRVYRGLKDDDENSMLLLNVKPQTATTFLDTFPKKAKTKFIYKVTALDKAFNESAKATAWIQLPDIVPPAAPVLGEAILNGDGVDLKWSIVRTDAISGYDVYRTFENTKKKINTVRLTAAVFTDKDIAKKGLYQYYVQAIDSASLESRPSNNVYLNTAQQGTIKDVKLLLTQDARSKKVQVEIAGVTADEIQFVRLYRKDGDTGFKVLPYQFSVQPTIDDTSEPGKIYEYYVEVTDLGDQKMKSDVVNFNNP